MNTYHLKRIREQFEVLKNDTTLFIRYTAVNLKTFEGSPNYTRLEDITAWIFSKYLGVYTFYFWFRRFKKRKAKHNYRLLKKQQHTN